MTWEERGKGFSPARLEGVFHRVSVDSVLVLRSSENRTGEKLSSPKATMREGEIWVTYLKSLHSSPLLSRCRNVFWETRSCMNCVWEKELMLRFSEQLVHSLWWSISLPLIRWSKAGKTHHTLKGFSSCKTSSEAEAFPLRYACSLLESERKDLWWTYNTRTLRRGRGGGGGWREDDGSLRRKEYRTGTWCDVLWGKRDTEI